MSLLVNVVNVFVDEDGAYGNPLGVIWASTSTRRREQEIAADLGFSETIFIDAVEGGAATARIFTPRQELPFAGHPTVGLAAWLRAAGDEVTSISVPAGTVRVRFEDDSAFVTARPEWTPAFEFSELDSPAEVLSVDPDAYSEGLVYVWAWSDRSARQVRARMFGPDFGIREDEATGAAAVRLSARLGEDLEILQGAGSRLRTRIRGLGGNVVEVGGRVSPSRMTELR